MRQTLYAKSTSRNNIYPGENDGASVLESSRVVVADCVAHGNYEQGFDVGANNELLYEHVAFRNCTSYENRKEGFKLAGDNMKSLKFATCVSRDNGGFSFTIQEGVQNSIVRKLSGGGQSI